MRRARAATSSDSEIWQQQLGRERREDRFG